MKKSAILILALLAFGFAPAYAEDGERIFKRRGCTTCHGANGGAPISPEYPAIAGQNKDYIVAQLKAFNAGHRKGSTYSQQMTPFATSIVGGGRHSEAEVAGLASYIAGGQVTSSPAYDSALAAKGKGLFVEKACSSCHGADAKSPIMPSYPKLAGLSPGYISRQITAFKKGGRKGTPESDMMAGMAAAVNNAEAKAIGHYLASLR